MRLKISLFLIIMFACVNITVAQKSSAKFVLSGSVVDVNRNPVQGVMIFIDGKKTEVLTDANGFYKIKVSNKTKSVSILTMTGLVAEEPIKGRTVINFQIKGSAELQNIGQNKTDDKEAINVGYGTINKNDLTTPVSKIDGTNPKYASYKNIYDMLRGEVPGVKVVGNSITIQGPTSLNSGTQPLLVVDGMVVETVDDIRPQQVKSIEILKGSAASIYGSRGANGVILINLIGTEKKK